MLEKIKCEVSKNRLGRIYTKDGISLPSVTTVLGKTAPKESEQALLNWLAVPGNKEEAARARDRGTMLHNVVEKFLKGEKPESNEHWLKVRPLFRQIAPILDQIEEIYLLEAPLFSEKLGIAGAVDIAAKINGKKAIIDIKTSSKWKRKEWILDYFIQETAYKEMFEEIYQLQIEELHTIIAIESGFSKGIHYIEKPNDALLSILNARIRKFNTL